MKCKWLPWALAGLLLVLLLVALYSSGKCPRRCYFPEFCEELAIPMPKDGVLPAPVTMEREVACLCGVKVKYSFKLEWHPDLDRGLYLYVEYIQQLKGWGSVRGGHFAIRLDDSALGFIHFHVKPYYLDHVSWPDDCGQHDFMFYMIPDLKQSTADKWIVKAGIGFPRELFDGSGNYSRNNSSVWHKAFANVRYAFSGWKIDDAKDAK